MASSKEMMKRAAAKRAEAKKPKKQLDLVEFMFSLGDSKAAVDARSQVLGAVATIISTNFNRFCYNASLGKTTHCEGIQINGETVADFDVSIGNPVATAMIMQDLLAEYEAGNGDRKYAGVAMYADKLTHRVSPAVCYVHSKGTMVVSKWQRGAIVEFVANETCAHHQHKTVDETWDKLRATAK